ncbi:hypothetical protein C5167_007437 [Papaver somniferum]|nr:hypothetical protein C5167_007437 [Papaver somniferum]
MMAPETKFLTGFLHVILLSAIVSMSEMTLAKDDITEITSQTGPEMIRPGDIYHGALRKKSGIISVTGSEICKLGDIYDAVLCGPTQDCGK